VAIYTFSALIFRLRSSTNLFRAWLIVAGIWIAIILNVSINVGINGSHFYVPGRCCEFIPFTREWKLNLSQGCWIASEFKVQQIVADYLWMWISAFASVLAYVAVFLVLRGFVKVEGWRVRWTPRQEPLAIRPSQTVAYKMLV
jgi:hypothetical protein